MGGRSKKMLTSHAVTNHRSALPYLIRPSLFSDCFIHILLLPLIRSDVDHALVCVCGKLKQVKLYTDR